MILYPSVEEMIRYANEDHNESGQSLENENPDTEQCYRTLMENDNLFEIHEQV